jgi:hypothetical protein
MGYRPVIAAAMGLIARQLNEGLRRSLQMAEDPVVLSSLAARTTQRPSSLLTAWWRFSRHVRFGIQADPISG